MSYELIAVLMFSSMMLLLLTGQRVFGAIGAVGAFAALTLWGVGGSDLPFSAAMKLMKWYPLLTLPMFIFMGNMLDKSGAAENLMKSFQELFGRVRGGLAITVILIGIILAASTGIIGASVVLLAVISLPAMRKQGYSDQVALGTIASSGTLGILIPPIKSGFRWVIYLWGLFFRVFYLEHYT